VESENQRAHTHTNTHTHTYTMALTDRTNICQYLNYFNLYQHDLLIMCSFELKKNYSLPMAPASYSGSPRVQISGSKSAVLIMYRDFPIFIHENFSMVYKMSDSHNQYHKYCVIDKSSLNIY
jgi:hypothetical protein